MANLVTALELREILDSPLTDGELDNFITITNTLVSSILSGKGLSAAILKEIERFLSAHLVSVSNRDIGAKSLKSDKISDATQTFGGEYGQGFESSQYGQQALLLDTTGCLKTLGSVPVTFNVF